MVRVSRGVRRTHVATNRNSASIQRDHSLHKRKPMTRVWIGKQIEDIKLTQGLSLAFYIPFPSLQNLTF